MENTRTTHQLSSNQTNRTRLPLVGLTAAAACFAGNAYAQDTGATVVLPTVDIETTQAPAPAPRRTQAAPRRQAASPAPQVCTPALAGTPVCAAQEAAEAQARAEAEAAAAAAEAARRARAGTNPNADPEAPFKADRLTNSRVIGEVLDAPRTVTTVTSEVLETTNTTSVRELARTTPGISLGFGEGGNAYGDNIYIRGFKANNDVYVDGVRDPGTSIRENFNTEQVEVLKGPSGSVGGRGTTGGALNVATKKPQDVDFQHLTVGVTDAGTVRSTFDVNWGEDERMKFRLNGMFQDGEVAGRDGVYDNRRGLAAAFRYDLSETLTLEADLSHTEIEQLPDWGVGFITDPDDTDGIVIPEGPITEFGVPRDTFYGITGRDFQEVTRTVGNTRLTWDMGSGLTLTNTLRGARTINDYILTGPGQVDDNGSTDPNDWTVAISDKSLYQETDVISNTTEVTGTADWFGARHTFTTGILLQRESISTDRYGRSTEDFPVGARGCTVSAINPDVGPCWDGAMPQLSGSTTDTRVNTISAYFVDKIELSEQWSVDAGLRLDHYDITRSGVSNAGEAYEYARTDTMWNGNLGVTYKPQQNLSFYGAIGTSSNPMGHEVAAGGGFYGGLDEAGQDLAPERNTSIEAGVKYEFADHLLLTAAVFQTTKDNGRETLGRGASAVTADSLKYRFTGLELGVAGRVGERVGLFGGAVLMDSEILESAVASNVGQSLATIAHRQANLLVTYDVTDRLMIGGQINWQDEVELGSTAPNGNVLPSYVTLDLVGSYEISKTSAVNFGVKNVADKTFYDTAYRSGEPFTYVGPGREVWATLEMKF